MLRLLMFNHHSAEVIGVPLLVSVSAILLWWMAPKMNKWVGIPLRAVSAVLILILLFFGLEAAVLSRKTKTNTSQPIYSPDGRYAVRIRDWDAGRKGTDVELYSLFGLREDEIVRGDYRSTEPEDVRWVSNSEVVLKCRRSIYIDTECVSTGLVHVTCVPVE